MPPRAGGGGGLYGAEPWRGAFAVPGSYWRPLFRRKSIDAALAETEASGFRRALGAIDLTGIGVAAIIGAGIFFLLGNQARSTGPAVAVSLVIGAVAAILSALTYAEFASALPGSGSAYLYAFTTLGAFPAFLMGWIILNAYMVGNMTVALGWSNYLAAGLASAGVIVPARFLADPFDGGVVNLPAAAVVLAVTALTLPRIRESTSVNNVLVALKILIVLFVIGFGFLFVRPANFAPFAPGGVPAVAKSTAILFFAYLGYDTVAATGAEAKNPRRDLPLGIVLSVSVAAVLYVLMAVVVTGMTAAARMPTDRPPIPAGFEAHGYGWASALVTVGAVVGLTTVIFAFQVALARILHAMATDGFLPRRFARLHPSTGTPWALTIITGVVTALGAGLLPLDSVADMTVLASIAMYVLVAVGVLSLKARHVRARFQAHWAVAVLTILVMVVIAAAGVAPPIHLYFAMWVALGLVLYGFYGHRAALRRRDPAPADEAAGTTAPVY